VKVDRPRAAFDLGHSKFSHIESNRLINLLTEVATKTSEPEEHFPIKLYEIEQALKSLNQRENVAHMELVRLEYLYVEILSPFSEYGIPNLAKEISESPMLFMQLLALCSRRKDNKKDPSEWQLPAKLELNQNIASGAYSALENASVIPGTQNNGKINIEQLRDWINKVRSLAKENSRENIADKRIGQILSKSSVGEDGVWPREEIRQIFEEVASKEISIGMEIGIRNAQGAGFRPRDDAPEHELAKKYQSFANKVMNETPFVGRMLMRIADSYKHDAEWHDTDDRVQRFLHN
jgi:DNA-binding transcriptional regulator YhcF (GntR family)